MDVDLSIGKSNEYSQEKELVLAHLVGESRVKLLINCHLLAYRANVPMDLQDQLLRELAFHIPANRSEHEQKFIYFAALLIGTHRPIPSDIYAQLLRSQPCDGSDGVKTECA